MRKSYLIKWVEAEGKKHKGPEIDALNAFVKTPVFQKLKDDAIIYFNYFCDASGIVPSKLKIFDEWLSVEAAICVIDDQNKSAFETSLSVATNESQIEKAKEDFLKRGNETIKQLDKIKIEEHRQSLYRYVGTIATLLAEARNNGIKLTRRSFRPFSFR